MLFCLAVVVEETVATVATEEAAVVVRVGVVMAVWTVVIAFEDGNGDKDGFLFALDPNTPPKTAAITTKKATIPP